jgi:hypothetical protein
MSAIKKSNEAILNIDKNIVNALNKQRPNDKILKVLSNKFAVVKPAYINGNFDEPQVCGLHNGIIYFYGYVKTIENFYEDIVKPKYNKYEYTHLNNNTIKKTFIKVNRYKSLYVKILKLLK